MMYHEHVQLIIPFFLFPTRVENRFSGDSLSRDEQNSRELLLEGPGYVSLGCVIGGSDGYPMGHQWVNNGLTMGIQWVNNG